MSSLYSTNYQLKSHKRDHLIEFIKQLLLTPFILSTKPNPDTPDKNRKRYVEILLCLEELIIDHIKCTTTGKKYNSRLFKLVPTIGDFFTALPLVKAFEAIDSSRSFVERRFVPPSFNDVRYILNHAQIIAISKSLQLITFDGDLTLYSDGADFNRNSNLVGLILTLLTLGTKVAIVTAAGYGRDSGRYEKRLSGLLDGFRESTAPANLLENFYVMGGECNYLYRYSTHNGGHLEYLEEALYQPEWMKEWSFNDAQIQKLLDVTEKHLNLRLADMKLGERATVLRKTRAIGVNPRPGCTLVREQLDELALSVQTRLNAFQTQEILKGQLEIPFCAFNGGSDCWVDIGNKLIGVKILQEHFGVTSSKTLHVGDQFLSTGNDIATRSTCCTVWITSPQETATVLEHLTNLMSSSSIGSPTRKRSISPERGSLPLKKATLNN